MAPQSSTVLKARRFLRLTGRKKAILAEAVLGLLLARAALVLTPFPRLAARWGAFRPPSDWAPRGDVGEQASGRAEAADVAWAVARAARYAPFRAVCLPQAMAARWMLQRRGVASVMHFGAAREGGTFGVDVSPRGHAWVDAAGVEVAGYPAARDCVEIARFV